MKNRKGRIHPAPAADALAALSFLPAAVLAMAAGLRVEDREVLAYLVTRSAKSAAATEERAAPHAAAFDCGCFECYMSFWLRWDSSPDRETIHRAIEAFEEHLASSEKRMRRRERRGKGVKRREEEKEAEEKPRVEVEVERATTAEEEVEVEVEKVEEKGEVAEERRRGWPDVMGIVNWRFWNLWSPGD